MARIHAVRLGWEGHIDSGEKDVRGTKLKDLEDCGLVGPWKVLNLHASYPERMETVSATSIVEASVTPQNWTPLAVAYIYVLGLGGFSFSTAAVFNGTMIRM
jgi:hypothetical protein